LIEEKESLIIYRLSRARRVIESTFGILVARWKIYRKPIVASLTLSERIVQATCCLHNFIINCEGNDRYYSTLAVNHEVASEGLQDITNSRYYEINSSRNVANIRTKFAMHFEGDGAIPWQWEKALLNDF